MTDSVRLGLLAAYRKLLQPLVRLLIRSGISFGETAEVLKAVLVEVAGRDFDLPERKTSMSRIAILTGLTRKEVAKQQGILDSGELNVDTNLNRVIRVLEGWHTDPTFTGPYGLLSRKAKLRASVPEPTPTQWGAPQEAANSVSKFEISGPRIH
jgi:hypothetical protein